MRPSRVCVIGCCGAGKTTLSRRLADAWRLPLVHADRLFWNPGWVQSSMEQFEARVAEEVARPEWLIDGAYDRTLKLRLARADLVIWLDYPTWLCLWRMGKRLLVWWGRTRPDMNDGCRERFNAPLTWFVLTYRRRVRPRLQATLSDFSGTLLRFTRPAELEHWMRAWSFRDF